MRLAVLAMILAPPATAETVTAARMIRAQTVISADDLAVTAEVTPGALSDVAEALGREARVALYPGRPIRATDLTAPALIERNAPVTIAFAAGGLAIRAEGRALDRAAAGEALRVMNLASRQTVTGRVGPDGTVHVGTLP